jgi:hypothetical protein
MKLNRKTRYAQKPGYAKRERAHQAYRAQVYYGVTSFKRGRKGVRMYKRYVARKTYFFLDMMTYPRIW